MIFILTDLSCLSLEEVDSVSEIGVLANNQLNWGHNTTSTCLTAGPPSAGTGPPQPQPPAAAAPISNTDFYPQSFVIGSGHHPGSDGQLMNDRIGLNTNGHYSTVPCNMYSQPAPPLSTPLRQFISQGQNMTGVSGNGVNQSVHLDSFKMKNSRDEISSKMN